MLFYIGYVVLATSVVLVVNYLVNKRLQAEDGLHKVLKNERDADRIVASF